MYIRLYVGTIVGITTVMSQIKVDMDETMTSSIVFADDDTDNDYGSNGSMQSLDNFSKPDARRGILRHPTKHQQSAHARKPIAAVYYQDSFPSGPVPGTVLHEGDAIFWPHWETQKQRRYNLDRNENTANRTESWEANETGSGAAARKKLTVRFSPDADGAYSVERMREFGNHVQDQHKQSNHCLVISVLFVLLY